MTQTAIFWPMIAQVALVFIVYYLTFTRRKAAVMSGKARISQFRENLDEPAESLFARNNLTNQFELPVLFHVVCLALYVTNGAGIVPLVLAWVFVLSRYLHSYIHVTSNRIRYRQPAFVLGFLMVALLWIWLALHLLLVV